MANLVGSKTSPYFAEEQLLIAADIETVWRLMVEWDHYPEWNPFIVRVDILSKSGQQVDKMKFHLRWADGRRGTSLEQMVRCTPPTAGTAELVYKYNAFPAKVGLLRATRVQSLRTVGAQTEYYTKETFRGPLARFIPLAAVQKGFSAQTQALARAASAKHTRKTAQKY